MKVSQISPHIVLVEQDTSEELADTFVRIQEYYESPLPEIKGQIFTLGFMNQKYSTDYECSTGGSTYRDDVAGFNVPSTTLKPFIQGLFDPLTEGEAKIVDLFRFRTDTFYIIGAAEGAESTLNHEIAHGLWYTEPQYCAQAKKLMADFSLAPVEKWLKKAGYCRELFEDECHAYVSQDYQYLTKDKGLDIPKLKPLHFKLDRLFQKYR